MKVKKTASAVVLLAMILSLLVSLVSLSVPVQVSAATILAHPAEGDYVIVPVDFPNFAIDLAGGGNANPGTFFQIWSRNGTIAQTLTLKRSGDSYRIIYKYNGLVMNLQYANPENDARIWAYYSSDYTNASLWNFHEIQGNPGVYVIQSKSSGKVLDLHENKPYDSAILHMWDFHAGHSCRWKLLPVNSGGNTSSNSSVSSKLNSFLSDPRWKANTSWGYYQKPKLSSYSCIGCCAFTADLVKYVYEKNSPRAGTYFSSPSAIRAGDVLYLTPSHWVYVISRSGNTLRIAHGNWGGNVVVDNYSLNGRSIAGKTFQYGYHFA